MTAEQPDRDLVQRYKDNYAIPSGTTVTEAMILRHWDLERRLRTELFASTPDDRWAVFARSYDALYAELDWLNPSQAEPSLDRAAATYANWTDVVGPPPLRIYEIGSGQGRLIHLLASRGHRCKGSEVTRERGATLAPAHPNLSWGLTDGVHLDRFEPPCAYDVVISNQVVEHLHPDDLGAHLAGAFAILAEGGRYVVATPHAHAGPSDVSRVFGCDAVMGMHLKEYTHDELRTAFRAAGFRRVRVVLRAPARYRRWAPGLAAPRTSAVYTRYVVQIERLVSLLPRQALRRRASSALRPLLFPPTILMVAEKRSIPAERRSGPSPEPGHHSAPPAPRERMHPVPSVRPEEDDGDVPAGTGARDNRRARRA